MLNIPNFLKKKDSSVMNESKKMVEGAITVNGAGCRTCNATCSSGQYICSSAAPPTT